jgi:hypothetical protein
LRDPIAEAVISLHEAFRIPLFFLRAEPDKGDKELAYVTFEKRDGSVSVLCGKKPGYDTTKDTSFKDSGKLPGRGNALTDYKRLLERPDLMLALDARELLLSSAAAS